MYDTTLDWDITNLKANPVSPQLQQLLSRRYEPSLKKAPGKALPSNSSS